MHESFVPFWDDRDPSFASFQKLLVIASFAFKHLSTCYLGCYGMNIGGRKHYFFVRERERQRDWLGWPCEIRKEREGFQEMGMDTDIWATWPTCNRKQKQGREIEAHNYMVMVSHWVSSYLFTTPPSLHSIIVHCMIKYCQMKAQACIWAQNSSYLRNKLIHTDSSMNFDVVQLTLVLFRFFLFVQKDRSVNIKWLRVFDLID